MFSIRQKLSLLPGALLLCGVWILDLKKYPQIDIVPYFWILAILVASVSIDFLMRKYMPDADPYIFPLAMLFISVGLITIDRLKPALFIPQMRWVLIGLAVFIGVIRYGKNIHRLVQYQYIVGVFCLASLCSTLLFGTDIGGHQAWIIIGPFQVQPSEFAKLLIILFLSAYLTDHKNVLSLPSNRVLFLRLPPLRFIAPLVVIWGMSVLMFIVQRDLGSALLFFGIAVFITYMATGNKSYVFLASVFFSVAGTATYFLFAHVRVRIAIWLHPWADPTGQAYQIVQSLFAFGSGGLLGSGFDHGYPGLIPEVHTDFIFSAIGEELGLLGALAVIAAYLLLFYRGFRIALQCRNEMRMLLAAGLSISLALQVFIILAGITKLLPLTGITLPFLSYGGSSMVSSFITLGLLFVLSKKENSNG
jgi:cell division protein FtsW (lipid II flippase)